VLVVVITIIIVVVCRFWFTLFLLTNGFHSALTSIARCLVTVSNILHNAPCRDPFISPRADHVEKLLSTVLLLSRGPLRKRGPIVRSLLCAYVAYHWPDVVF
jgi:hypothetical protein